MKDWLVIDTGFVIGVGPMVHFIAENELEKHLQANKVDLQYVYQPDESFTHTTPQWNPYLGNDYVASIQRQFEGRVRGLATIQAWHQAIPCNCGAEKCPQGIDIAANVAFDELDRAILELGLWGIRINPPQHNYPINSRSISWPLLRRLSQLQEQCNRRLVVSVYSFGDHFFNTPERMMETAKEFPELLFIMQHAGLVWGCLTLTQTAACMENVYLDITNVPQIAVIAEYYKIFGIKKFCIGTDGPYGDYRVKMAIAKEFCQTEEDMKCLLGGNLARMLCVQHVKKRSRHEEISDNRYALPFGNERGGLQQ